MRSLGATRTAGSLRWVLIAGGCVSLFPILFLLLNDAWLYNGVGYRDAEINIGLARRLLNHEFGHAGFLYYKTARASLLLIQMLFRESLPFQAAQIGIALAPIGIIAIATWRTTSGWFGRPIAMFVTGLVIFSSYLYVLRYSGGPDYGNQFGAAFVLLAVDRFVAATRRPHLVRWTLFGIVLGLSVHCNLLTTTVLGGLILVEAIGSWPRLGVRRWLWAIPGSLLGFGAATSSMMAIYWYLGQYPYFPTVTARFIRMISDVKFNYDFLPPILERPEQLHLGTLGATCALCVVAVVWLSIVLIRRAEFREILRSRPALLSLQFLTLAGYFVWEWSKGKPLLDQVHHTHPLLIGMCVTMGGLVFLLRNGTRNEEPRGPHPICEVLIVWAAIFIGLFISFFWSASDAPPVTSLILSGVAVLAAFGIALFFRERRSVATAIVALCLAWGIGASGELRNYDEHGWNREIYSANQTLWDTLKTRSIKNDLWLVVAPDGETEVRTGGHRSHISNELVGLSFTNSLGFSSWVPLERILGGMPLNCASAIGRDRGILLFGADERTAAELMERLEQFGCHPDTSERLELGTEAVDIPAHFIELRQKSGVRIEPLDISRGTK